MIVINDVIQGSAEWLRLRAGVLTASQIDKLITPKTLKLSGQRESLINTLVAERLLGEPVQEFAGTYWTERGHQLEQEAGDYFAFQTGHDPRAVGFVFRDESRTTGCSPDWMIPDGDNWLAGVEVKCPAAHTHVGYLRAGEAVRYSPQVQYSLWVTGLPAWYFLSYFPGLPPVLQRIEPDSEWQAALNATVPVLLDEVEQAVSAITGGNINSVE